MVIYLITMGKGMPRWVTEGFRDYATRLTQEVRLQLIEVPLLPRRKESALKETLKIEAKRMLKAIPLNCYVVGFDVKGQALTTEKLSEKLTSWMGRGQDIALLIGGPEGFSEEVKAHFKESLSLSLLTLPHPLVRVMVAEQLFRAWSIVHNHPYHRA